MADDKEIEAAFERGRRVGRLEGLCFGEVPSAGTWLPGARLEFRETWFDSFVAYERQIVWNLRMLQRTRWLLHRGDVEAMAGLPRRIRRRKGALERIEWELKEELWQARAAVDAEIEEGRGRGCVVAALRALPQRPATAVEYADPAAFVVEDRRRGIARPGRPELRPGGGFGYDWRLENPFRRWETSQWRIAWLCSVDKLSFRDAEWVHEKKGDDTDEVYACETIRDADGKEHGGRVWLLGTLHTYAAMERALDELRRHAMDHRNSLVAAAEAVARAEREEPWLPFDCG